jgi:hypothetical protein
VPSTWNGSTGSPYLLAYMSWPTCSAPSSGLYARDAGTNTDFRIESGGTASAPELTWHIRQSTEPAEGTYVVGPAGRTFTSGSSPSESDWYKASE